LLPVVLPDELLSGGLLALIPEVLLCILDVPAGGAGKAVARAKHHARVLPRTAEENRATRLTTGTKQNHNRSHFSPDSTLTLAIRKQTING